MQDVSIDKAGGVHVNVEMAPLSIGVLTWQANLPCPSLLARDAFTQQIFQLKEVNNFLFPALKNKSKEVAVGHESRLERAVVKIENGNASHTMGAFSLGEKFEKKIKKLPTN